MCMAGKIPGTCMSCMGLGRGVRVKNDHVWINMDADRCRRVSKHVGVESKNITRIKPPEPSIQPTVKTQKQPTTRSMLMENAKIRKMKIRIQGQGEMHSLETLYKQNAQ